MFISTALAKMAGVNKPLFLTSDLHTSKLIGMYDNLKNTFKKENHLTKVIIHT